jgi:hypothetical protein
MHRRLGFWAVFSVLAAGCTSLLGDFGVGAGPGGGGDGGGGDGGNRESGGNGDDGGTTDGPTDGPTSDSPDASGTLTCALNQNTYRKVVDNADGGTPIQAVRIFNVSQSSARVVPKVNGGSPPLVYSFRTDRPENPNFTTLPFGSLDQTVHNKTSASSPTLDFLVSMYENNTDGAPSGTQRFVFSLPDNQDSPQFSNFAVPLLNAQSLSAPSNNRSNFVPVGPTDYFLLFLAGNAIPYQMGIAHASPTTPGNILSVCPSGGCTMTPPGFDSPPFAVGSFVYAFGVQIPSTNPTTEYQWPTTADTVGSPPRTAGLGSVFPIGITDLGGGNAQVLAGTLQFSDAGAIVSLSFLGATLPPSKLMSFTLSDLKTITTVTDIDKAPFGPNTGLAVYPGHAAALGSGGAGSGGSTGLNFELMDIANATLDVSIVGSGHNLLAGNPHIIAADIDYAPTIVLSTAFDVAWVEQVVPDAGTPYQAIYYEKLECK